MVCLGLLTELKPGRDSSVKRRKTPENLALSSIEVSWIITYQRGEIMTKEITAGIILAFCGAAIGYVVKTVEERPQPTLLIESVALKTVPKEKVPDVDVTKELQALSKESSWVSNLSDRISFKDLEALVKDHKETVEQLEKLSTFVPKLVQFVTSHAHEAEYKAEYRKFVARIQTRLP
jgi:hypothetical protein